MSHSLAKLTPKQAQALPLLAAGLTATEVSKRLKISTVKLSQWKSDANFSAALEASRRAALGEAMLALSGLAISAVSVLSDTLVSSESEQLRFKAAVYILDRMKLEDGSPARRDRDGVIIDFPALLKALGA